MIKMEQVPEIVDRLRVSPIKDVEKQFGSLDEIVEMIRQYPNASPTLIQAVFYTETLRNDLV